MFCEKLSKSLLGSLAHKEGVSQREIGEVGGSATLGRNTQTWPISLYFNGLSLSSSPSPTLGVPLTDKRDDTAASTAVHD